MYEKVHNSEIIFQILVAVWLRRNAAAVKWVEASKRCMTARFQINIVYTTTLWLKKSCSVRTVSLSLRGFPRASCISDRSFCIFSISDLVSLLRDSYVSRCNRLRMAFKDRCLKPRYDEGPSPCTKKME